MTTQNNAENYALLSQTDWGCAHPAGIRWAYDGGDAVAVFKLDADAVEFVDYLKSCEVITDEDLIKSILSDRLIEGDGLKIRIPLMRLDPVELRNMARAEGRESSFTSLTADGP